MAIAQRVWAFIYENEVKNTIICDTYPMANMLAKNTISNDAFAVEITHIPTSVGHKYEDGNFKDLNGNVIAPLPNTEQEVNILKSQNNELNQALTELSMLLGGLSNV